MAKIVVEWRKAHRSLNALEKSQWPFVLAKTLTGVAKAAQKNLRRRTRRQYGLHTEFIPKSIWIKAAKKAAIRHHHIAESEIFTTKRIQWFMEGHEFGQQRSPKDSEFYTVPGDDLPKRAFSVRGRIKPSWSAKTLLSRAGGGKRAKRGKGKYPSKAFMITGDGGTPLMVRRGSPNRYPLEILYIFKKRIKLKPTWSFIDTAKSVARNKFNSIFRRNMRDAIKTIK